MILAAVWKIDCRGSTYIGYCSNPGKGWRNVDKFGEHFRGLLIEKALRRRVGAAKDESKDDS